METRLEYEEREATEERARVKREQVERFVPADLIGHQIIADADCLDPLDEPNEMDYNDLASRLGMNDD